MQQKGPSNQDHADGLVMVGAQQPQGGAQWSKRVKTEKKLTGSKIGGIFRKIASRITTQNLKIRP